MVFYFSIVVETCLKDKMKNKKEPNVVRLFVLNIPSKAHEAEGRITKKIFNEKLKFKKYKRYFYIWNSIN